MTQFPNQENTLLTVDEATGFATLTINRPDKLNALNTATIGEIGQAIRYCQSNDAIQAIILTGAGEKAFVAGADIKEIASLEPGQGGAFSQFGTDVFSAIESSHKVVIAAINGFALGGGCELAMACHLRVAVANAKFGQPEVNLGLTPGYAGTQRLVHLIGKTKALELLLTGAMITANEALQLGLVNYVVEDQAALMAKCNELLTTITGKAPKAVEQVIRLVNEAVYHPGTGIQSEVEAFGYCTTTDDFKEGTAAFLEKRKPAFRNG